jgi:pilus assembly protein Flp/PilA
MNKVARVFRESRGGEFIEYIIICGVIALLAIAAFTTFGDDVRAKIIDEGSKVSGIQD